MEDSQYFSIDCLSASRLGVVRCLRDGLELPKMASKEALVFGQQLHQAALEAAKYAAALKTDPAYKKNYFKIVEMIKACKENGVFCDMMAAPGEVEKSLFFREPTYDLEFKIKMDKHMPGQKTVFDLKSTAAQTHADFLESCMKYGYHRQGALYLDGSDSNKFVIIGVSKTYPHPTFTVIWMYDAPELVQGRQEIDELINYYITMPEKPDFKALM